MVMKRAARRVLLCPRKSSASSHPKELNQVDATFPPKPN
jgi:hypothetical protein